MPNILKKVRVTVTEIPSKLDATIVFRQGHSNTQFNINFSAGNFSKWFRHSQFKMISPAPKRDLYQIDLPFDFEKEETFLIVSQKRTCSLSDLYSLMLENTHLLRGDVGNILFIKDKDGIVRMVLLTCKQKIVKRIHVCEYQLFAFALRSRARKIMKTGSRVFFAKK